MIKNMSPDLFLKRKKLFPFWPFLCRIGQAFVDFCFNSYGYQMSQELQREHSQRESLFLLLIMGESLGVPVLSHFYSCRLWPYLLPKLPTWKRSLLRPKGLEGW